MRWPRASLLSARPSRPAGVTPCSGARARSEAGAASRSAGIVSMSGVFSDAIGSLPARETRDDPSQDPTCPIRAVVHDHRVERSKPFARLVA